MITRLLSDKNHPIKSANSFLTFAITLDQSPVTGCLNSLAVGYHGLSSRSSSHRQSQLNGNNIHTGLPIAPARWATDVSTEITTSINCTSAAVSVKSFSSLPKCSTLFCSPNVFLSAALTSFCKLINCALPDTSSSNWASGIDRLWSFLCSARPDHTSPTRGTVLSPSNACHCRTRSLSL